VPLYAKKFTDFRFWSLVGKWDFPRYANKLKLGLANHRLQPLGHSSIYFNTTKTADRKLVDLIKQIENKEEEVPDSSFKD